MKLLAWALCLWIVAPSPQELSPQAPVDKPGRVSGTENVRKFEAAIAPYVKKARATLPQAKKRYLKGLARGEYFSVTTRLYAPDGKFEQVFVFVTSWKEKAIEGNLAGGVSLPGHKDGEIVRCTEEEVFDWTISKPDGSEEGNFVGKFLDTYKP